MLGSEPWSKMAKPDFTDPAALRLDLVAGLTAAAVVLPKAMAYATVAGLPVSVGLYTAFVPMIVYALLVWGVVSVLYTLGNRRPA